MMNSFNLVYVFWSIQFVIPQLDCEIFDNRLPIRIQPKSIYGGIKGFIKILWRGFIKIF